jgi:hypothetical protein
MGTRPTFFCDYTPEHRLQLEPRRCRTTPQPPLNKITLSVAKAYSDPLNSLAGKVASESAIGHLAFKNAPSAEPWVGCRTNATVSHCR